jgi:hypothetical protein
VFVNFNAVNTKIELHDSTLAGIVKQNNSVTVHFTPVYLHKSLGRPGLDSGSGWVQDARLIFTDSSVSGNTPDLPCDVLDGEFIICGQRHDNEIPVPLELTGDGELHLIFGPAHKLTVTGKIVRLELLGEAKFVEEYKR